MVGHLIEIEGKPIRYLAADEQLAGDRGNMQNFDVFEDRKLQQHPRIRRVLTALIRPLPLFYRVLHWSDGTDLHELDRKVLRGEFNDDDFAGALVAEPGTINCLNCATQLRILVVDGGQALFAKTLGERLRAHDLKQRCPSCRAHITLQIVEFFNEDRDL
ncbi:MAG: hypothetical protein DLM55_06800 [Acidimicrobiales bacterium]|nr:MAG: hypothetical protein DLM55_06800 [Acidimicrobiales bacterium]